MNKMLECPCCGKQCDVIKETPLMRMQERFTHACLPDNWIERYTGGSFYHWGGMQWACNRCIREGRAIEGKPWLQTFCDHPPYLAYFDKAYTCTDCREQFVFAAQEQQYWFEQLKFWVQAYPAQCLECRRKRHARNAVFQRLEKKLKALPEPHLQEPQHILDVASLYLQVGSYKKATEFLGRARNRARARGELAALADQIDSLKQQIQEALRSQQQEEKNQ